MKEAIVYIKDEPAGRLKMTDDRKYLFRYDDAYFADRQKPAISLTLPKTQQEFKSNTLFPFFFNMLAEGVNKRLQCRQLQIDENDHFSLLLATASVDTIGAITIKSSAS
ncbi:MAG: phosphatidylinositol kinase [Flavobacterium psychrophilum]|jgi:HipA-like protein|nr:MAG: phosphatidylinositol kinase [Flavobacterium psychrophilum]